MRDLVVRPFGMLDELLEHSFFRSGVDFQEPKINLTETENSYCVEVEVAGVPKENINIDVDGGALVVSVCQKEEKEEADKTYIRREIGSSNFTKKFKFTKEIDAGKIKAESKDGVLRIDIPKSTKSKSKRIKIT
jgi:HSP20 family protein